MNTKGLLIVSIIANLALLGAVGALLNKRQMPDDFASTQKKASSESLPETVAARKSSANTPANSISPAPRIHWEMVESPDYQQYIANLRSIGCPEETIRDIIVADVNKLFEARRQQLRAASTNKFEFWKAGSMFSGMMDEEKIKQKQEMAKEKRELLTTLLGVAPEEKVDMASMMNPFQDLLDFLPEATQSKVLDLMQSYQAKAMKSFKDGPPDASDMKEMQKVQKEMDVELAKIMTPKEYETYQLHLSQTSMMMRMQLASFEPSEQEFRDVFKLRKEFDDEHGAMGMGLSGDHDKLQAAQKELNEKVKGVLSAERYTEYERSQDHVYQGIAKVAQRQGLPKEAAVQVYDMKKAAEDAASKVRGDASLTPEQRKTRLEEVRKETERSIGGVLGQEGFDSYQKQPGAFWLRGISPNPKPTFE